MRWLQLTLLLGAVIVARCIPLTSEPTPDVSDTDKNEDELSTDDEIRLKLAETALPDDELEEIEEFNDVLEEDDPTESEDGISRRFWFWDKKPKKKKPIKIVTGAETLLHKPQAIIDHVKEKPGLIKPIIDKIKQPIHAVIDKTSEVANHLLEKPHKVLQKLGLEKPALVKPIEIIKPVHEDIDESVVDEIKKPIENILHQPALNEWASHEEFNPSDLNINHFDDVHESEQEFLNKPEIVPEIEHHSHIPDKTSFLDNIKKPIENLLNKPAEIAAAIFHKTKPDILHQPHIIENIKNPVEVILNKPVEIASHLINKPSVHIDKPGIVDHIKNPSEAILYKPTEIVSDLWNEPKPHSEVIHFPQAYEDQADTFVKPQDSIISISQNPKPFTHHSFYTGIHRFRPEMGFIGFEYPDTTPVRIQNTQNKPIEHQSQIQTFDPYWNSPYALSYANPSSSWPKKPLTETAQPHSANYGIPSGLYTRDFEPESSEEDAGYERLISFNPYNRGGEFIFI